MSKNSRDTHTHTHLDTRNYFVDDDGDGGGVDDEQWLFAGVGRIE